MFLNLNCAFTCGPVGCVVFGTIYRASSTLTTNPRMAFLRLLPIFALVVSSTRAQSPVWGQCGGTGKYCRYLSAVDSNSYRIGWTGATSCVAGYVSLYNIDNPLADLLFNSAPRAHSRTHVSARPEWATCLSRNFQFIASASPHLPLGPRRQQQQLRRPPHRRRQCPRGK